MTIIQENLETSNFYPVCSKFYLANIYFFRKNFIKSIELANNSIKLLENSLNTDDNNSNSCFSDIISITLSKLFNVLEFTTQIHEL